MSELEAIYRRAAELVAEYNVGCCDALCDVSASDEHFHQAMYRLQTLFQPDGYYGHQYWWDQVDDSHYTEGHPDRLARSLALLFMAEMEAKP